MANPISIGIPAEDEASSRATEASHALEEALRRSNQAAAGAYEELIKTEEELKNLLENKYQESLRLAGQDAHAAQQLVEDTARIAQSHETLEAKKAALEKSADHAVIESMEERIRSIHNEPGPGHAPRIAQLSNEANTEMLAYIDAAQDRGASSKEIKDKIAEINHKAFDKLAEQYPGVVEIKGSEVHFNISPETDGQTRAAIRQALRQVKEELNAARNGHERHGDISIGIREDAPGSPSPNHATPVAKAVTEEEFKQAVTAIQEAAKDGVSRAEADGIIKDNAKKVQAYLESQGSDLPEAGKKMLEAAKTLVNEDANYKDKDDAAKTLNNNTPTYLEQSREQKLEKAAKIIAEKLKEGDGISPKDMAEVDKQATIIKETLDAKEKEGAKLTTAEEKMRQAAGKLLDKDAQVDTVDKSAQAVVDAHKEREIEKKKQAVGEALDVATMVTTAIAGPLPGAILGAHKDKIVDTVVAEKEPGTQEAGRDQAPAKLPAAEAASVNGPAAGGTKAPVKEEKGR